MYQLKDYLDRFSIIKVLSFFLLIVLILTLIPIIFNFKLGSLVFKFILYSLMLVFFIHGFRTLNIGNGQWSDTLRSDLNSIFKTTKLYKIVFIVISNVLFVSLIYFILRYLGNLSIIQFNSPLFGDFSQFNLITIIIYFLTIVILSPIIEELLFRGIILNGFNREFNNLTFVILLSSILFGLCHNFGGILGAILFGICVSILYIKSRNILVPIFAHFLNNLISFSLALSGLEYFIQNNLPVIALMGILAILSNFVLFRAIIAEWPDEFV